MRMGFGLVGLLVVVAIIFWALYGPSGSGTSYMEQVATQGKQARQQAAQLAGKDLTTGQRVSDTFTMAPIQTDGHLKGVRIASIEPNSAMQSYFGLQQNDIVTEIGPLSVRDMNDYDLAKASIVEAYQRQEPLTILRGNRTLHLPADKNESTASETPSTAAPSNQPAAAPTTPPSGNSLRRQLDQIPGIPTH